MKKIISLGIILTMLLSVFVLSVQVSAETVDNHNLQPKMDITITPVTPEEFDEIVQENPDDMIVENLPGFYKKDESGEIIYDDDWKAEFIGYPSEAGEVYAYLVDVKVTDIGTLHTTYQYSRGKRTLYGSRSITAFALYFTCGNDTTLFNTEIAKNTDVVKSIIAGKNTKDLFDGSYLENIYSAKGTSYGVFWGGEYDQKYPLPTQHSKSSIPKRTDEFDEFRIRFFMFTTKEDFDIEVEFDMSIANFDVPGSPVRDSIHNYSLFDDKEIQIPSISYFEHCTINGENTMYYRSGNGTPEYTIVFNDSAEAAAAKGLEDVKLKEVVVKLGDPVIPPQNPADYETEDTVYQFAGWSDTYTSPTEDMTVTAEYNALPKRTVKFMNEDGVTQIGETIYSKVDDFVEETDLPEVTKEEDEDYYYEFAGWKELIAEGELAPNFAEFPFRVVHDTVFVPVFEPKEKITVIFENEDGTEYHKEIFPVGTSVSAPENLADYETEDKLYKFAGWRIKDAEDDTIISFPLAPIVDVTFVPVFTEYDLYTVVFENADGTVASSQKIADGSKVAILDPVIKEDIETETYEFLYWTLDDEDATRLFPYTVTEDVTFKPEYKIIPKHLVTFYNGDGSVFETQRVKEGTKATMPGNVPEKADTSKVRYTFKNWQAVINNNVTRDVSIYPVFTPEYINTRNYIMADANIDGIVDARDGILYAKHLAETALFDEVFMPYVDLNEDGEVTMADLEILVEYLITEELYLIK